MTEVNACPRCGNAIPSQAPAGICPRCLLEAGIAPPDAGRPTVSQTPTSDLGRPFEPPPVDVLAPLFPQLKIESLLGQGGMGAVYRAEQTRLGRTVALKIIRPEAAEDASFAERFNREARTLARLNHPHIVGVHDFGEVQLPGNEGQVERTIFYFLMEYVDGANLRQLLESGELTPARALSIVPQICDALQFAHDAGVVHRDIKPENVLVDLRGGVKIADFGLAKLMSDDAAELQLTGTYQVMGTPRYMAPEQMEGARAVDHRADIYSLGVVFYEMLTGELPLGRFAPPSGKSELDHQWDEVVLRALEKEPGRRYQHASEVKSEVERLRHQRFGSGSQTQFPQHRPAHADLGPDRQPVQPVKQNEFGLEDRPLVHWGLLILGLTLLIGGASNVLWLGDPGFSWIDALGVLQLLFGFGFSVASFVAPTARQGRPKIVIVLLAGALLLSGLWAALFLHQMGLRMASLESQLVPIGGFGLWIGIKSWFLTTAGILAALAWPLPSPDRSWAVGPVLTPEAQARRDDAASQLALSTLGMFVAGVVNVACLVPWLIMLSYGNSRFLGGSEEVAMVWLFGATIIGIPVLFGAMKLRHLELYPACVIAAALSAFPVAPGALIGIPAGLWSLMLLTRPGIKRVFDEGRAASEDVASAGR